MSNIEHRFIRYQVETEIEGIVLFLDIMELLAILGTANEHEFISVQQISQISGYDTKTVRKRLKWAIKKLMLSGTLEDDMFMRRHRMRTLHIEYTHWHEHPEEYPLE
ncbi:MAG: hypothetical protein RTU63_10985 [Candidatus Thorarchaeota archaeon]